MRRLSLAAALCWAAGSAQAFSSKFDGDWTVDVRTTVGACAAEIEGAVTIQNGRIVASSGEGVGVWGYVEENGDIVGRFTQGQDMLRGNGKLGAGTGKGAWSSNTRYCGGTWSARRGG